MSGIGNQKDGRNSIAPKVLDQEEQVVEELAGSIARLDLGSLSDEHRSESKGEGSQIDEQVAKLADFLTHNPKLLRELTEDPFEPASASRVRQEFPHLTGDLTNSEIGRAIVVAETIYKQETVSELQEFIYDAMQILEGNPKNWMKDAVEFLSRHQNAVVTDPDSYSAEVQEFLSKYAEPILEILAERQRSPNTSDADTLNERIADSALDVIHEISYLFENDMTIMREHAPIEVISIDEIIANRDGIVKVGSNVWIEHSNGTWHWFPFPESDGLYHKGGFARVLNKIEAGAPQESIDAELPPNDFDVVTHKGNIAAIAEARRLKIEEEGIEVVTEIDRQQIVNDRDNTLNSVIVGKEGLIRTKESAYAARTGKIRALQAEKGIYGTEIFIKDDVPLIKNRGMARLIKVLAEEKAQSFEMIPRNEQIDLGIYWLVLAKRFDGRPNTPDLLGRLYELGKQAGQVREGEDSIYDVLERVHEEFPFFDFSEQEFGTVGVARWLAGKLGKQAKKLFKENYSVPSKLEIQPKAGDTDPYLVTLEEAQAEIDRKSTPEARAAEFAVRWPELMQRLQARTTAYDNDDIQQQIQLEAKREESRRREFETVS